MEETTTAFWCDLSNERTLARRYLPWMIRGGLFIANPARVEIGRPAFLTIRLPGKALPTFASGRVAWRSSGGFGIHFDEGYDDLVDLCRDLATEFAGPQRPAFY